MAGAEKIGVGTMMKRIILLSTILIIIFVAGLFITRLSSPRSFDDLNQELEYMVSGLAVKDKSVRNCVLSVMEGDGSFSWSGAACIASQDGQVPITKILLFISRVSQSYILPRQSCDCMKRDGSH